jgi:MinD-like ATPase involved in chromosome partitioning or flagellar assembly
VATGIGVGKTNITATLSGLTSQLVGLPVTSQ